MMNEQYGECNVIVTLGAQKVPAKRRLSQSKSPMNKIARGDRCTSVSSNELEDQQEIKETTKWPCHTKVLYNESPYFAALFGENFIESKASLVYLPSSIIDSNAFDSIIYYMYKHEINTPKRVEELCNMYSASDYLGMNKLCNQLLESLYEVVHKCLCYCNTCVNNVPELFSFCRIRSVEFQDEKMAQMTQRVMTILANDPEKTLSTYWTGRHMAKLLIQLPQDVSQALSQKILYRVNKSNAIESLYACFSASNILSTSDPLLSWSKPLHATLTSVQSKATLIIARHFDFFCCQYPALLSCIDGITYSLDFLEYLLLHILEDQMDTSNVGILYEGVVCDLMSRHAVEYNHQVKHILNVAKVMILCYITRRIGDIRQNGGLDKLEKNVLNLLADGNLSTKFKDYYPRLFIFFNADLDVRPKSLISSSHPLSTRGIFSFLIPSVPDINLSTSTHTNGLSRHSSRSTTTSRRIILPNSSKPSNSFAKKLKRFLKRFGPNHDTVPRLSNRYASASTVHTTSSSWSHVRLSSNKTFSGKLKQRRRFSTSAVQVSAPMVGMNRRVQLTRRPVLTVGTVLFIGHVNFSEGIWIGVELDRRGKFKIKTDNIHLIYYI